MTSAPYVPGVRGSRLDATSKNVGVFEDRVVSEVRNGVCHSNSIVMIRNSKRHLALITPFTLIAALQACSVSGGDSSDNSPGGAPSQGPPGKDGEDGKPGKNGADGKDGKPGKDGVDGKDGSSSGGSGSGVDGYPSHLPSCQTKVPLEELEIDLFGDDGHTFYFEVTPEVRRAGDKRLCDDGGLPPIYVLGEAPSCPLSAFNVRVVSAGNATCVDTGLVELDLPGQSSWREWNEIPNFKLDVGEFQDQKFKTGDKNLRLNSGQADSTIVREATALAIWRAMDYPAPRTRFVKTQSNVWDYEYEPGVFAAHVMVQPYKKPFFSSELPEVTSAWEGEGNPFSGWSTLECEWSKDDDCQDDVLGSIVQVVQDAEDGAGFMEATSDVIDWPMIHRNQCLAALTGTGDDWIHNTNNVVIALSKDGKIIYLPYSTDISGGHPWYEHTSYDPPYYDETNLAFRCAKDPECRTMALDTCEAMTHEFDALGVVENIVQERCDTLIDLGLDRPSDEPVCAALEKFYGGRTDALREELEYLRNGGGMGGAGGESGVGGSPAIGGRIIID
jgi:hypothetical protein